MKADLKEEARAAGSRLLSGDLWGGAAVVVLGAIAVYGGFQVFEPRLTGVILGPRAFPLAVGGSLMVLGAALIARILLRPSTAERVDFGSRPALAVTAATIVGFIVLLSIVGFLLASSLFLTLLFVYLGERRIWLTLLIAIAVTAAIYAGFRYGLHVNLPRGIVGL